MSFRRPERHILSVMLAAVAGMALSLSASSFVAAKPAGIVSPAFDLTGNQVVNTADISVASDSWMAGLGSSQAGPDGADLDGSGQVDIADIQLLAAQIGQATTSLAQAALNQPQSSLAQATEKVFVVNSAASGRPTDKAFGDTNPGDGICATTSGSCTLQAAVQESNAPRTPPYRARINFNIREDDGDCPTIVRIIPNLDYQRWLQIDDSSGLGTIIDGYSQCGAEPNTEPIDGNADIRIEIVGTKFGAGGAEYPAINGVNGIEIKSANIVIRGLALYNWDRQIEISAAGALYNQIQGNFLGTDATNTFLRKSASTHHGEGLRLQYGASYTVIGCGSFTNTTYVPCTDPAAAYAARNIVAGNGNDGIHIERQDSHHNRIVGNYIGIAQDGRNRLDGNGKSISKNQADGVDFEAGANNNWLGGESALERNIISGNVSEGIEISHHTTTQNNRVVGNWFGLDAYGAPAPNGGSGISFEDTVNHNFAYKNYVGSNEQYGIRAYVLADYNEIYENVIGLNADGEARPNARHGVYIMGGSQHNSIHHNVITNNDRGVVIDTDSDADHNYFGETHFNTISQNSIYNNRREGIRLTSRTSSAPVGNQNLPKPVILGANTSLVVGTACPSCTIEVFIADKDQLPHPSGENSGEGRTFVGDGLSNGGGEFAVSISGVQAGQLLTVTATDQSGNTSEFARNFVVTTGIVPTLTPKPTSAPTRTPTATPTEPAGGPPVIVWANASLVVGTTNCAGCTVEIFKANTVKIGSGPTNGAGQFSISISAAVGDVLTATVTDKNGVTSTFAQSVTVQAGAAPVLTPAPTFTAAPAPPGGYRILMPTIRR